MRRLVVLCAVATALVAVPLRAQVVRGRVVESTSFSPVAGALVSLVGETSDVAIVSVLTASSGEYAVRAPAPGRYRVSVKRIGVRRHHTNVFDLADGQTRVVDVSIEPVAQFLPEVMVSGLCVKRANERSRISSLWDEARTALEATEISLRDQLMQARISRYSADLNVSSLQVLYDWRTEAGMAEEPFTSLSGEVLSAQGYWLESGRDSVEYMAPDARALASSAFLRDHCFSLASARKDKADLIGLAFEPARGRNLPDILGTIWIDSATLELRFVEFHYSRLPARLHRLWCRCALPMPEEKVGGEVHFSRLVSGAWIVHRWFVRVPQLITDRNQTGNRGLLGGVGGTHRQLREAGGAVSSVGVTASHTTGTVLGVVVDSANRPVAGAVIYALGTHRQTRTSADGAYQLDSLPSGGFSIVARTNDLDSLGILAGARRLELAAGDLAKVDFQTPDTKALRKLACPLHNVPWRYQPVGRGVLRLLMIDSMTAEPVAGVRLVVSWPGISENPMARPGSLRTREAISDSRGAASFCDLPAGIQLELSMDKADGLAEHLMMFDLTKTGIRGRVIRTLR